MKILRTLSLLFLALHLGAQVAVPMKLWPYEAGKWRFTMYGNYDGFVGQGTVRLDCFQLVDKEDTPSGAPGYGYQIQILTEDGKTWLGSMDFIEDTDFPDLFIWGSKTPVPVEGQPIGYRLMKNFKPFFEERFADPGTPPSLQASTEGAKRLIWEITAALSSDHAYSLDGGNTWQWMGSESNWESGFYDFKDEEIQTNPTPMIRFVSFHRMRRYVKYYTFGKGYHDDPRSTPVVSRNSTP